MRVFISWSGNQSQRLGEALRNWLPMVIQAIKPYFSPVDIEKGAKWSEEISKELEASYMGIICLTKSNLQAPWIMFEAGALAKSIDKSRVIPLLFGIEPINLQGPLLNFQAATFRQSEITKMLRGINFALGDNALDGRVLDSSIEKWWPELEGNINSIMAEAEVGSTVEFRTDRELLEETLQLARAVYYGSTVSGGEPILLRTLDYLKLTNRIIEALQAENIYYVGDLAIRTEAELLQARGMNKPGIDEIKTALAMRGLTLGLIMENWPPSGLG